MKHPLERRSKGHSQNDKQVNPQLAREVVQGCFVRWTIWKLLMCLLPTSKEVESLGVRGSVTPKADSRDQHPRHLCLLVSHESVFPRVNDSVSLIRNPAKSLPVICLLQPEEGRNLCHPELLLHARRPPPLQCLGRSALCCTRRHQKDRISAFQSKCLAVHW